LDAAAFDVLVTMFRAKSAGSFPGSGTFIKRG
jgi:hypothetical protein